eukprot:CCRYP_000138-RB/>CCRYP_000138-RB protein AED:0.05 eAED:0.05 QI:133/1/1/1/0.66/0.5/4/240/520
MTTCCCTSSRASRFRVWFILFCHSSNMTLHQLRNTILQTTTLTIGSIALLEVTTHLPSQGRAAPAYHSLFDSVVTPLGRRLFTPENAHHLALEVVRRNWAPRGRVGTGMEVEIGEERKLVVDSPIGLAAGFDKDGVAIGGLFDLGFSFVEIGSVTPLPQPGNAKPRSFRLVEDKGVINRFGFNSEGADVVRENLREYRKEFGGRGAGLIIDERSNVGQLEESDDEVADDHDSTSDENGDSKIVRETSIHLAQSFFDSMAWTLGWAWSRVVKSPQHRTGILGVNLGKNKTSEDEVKDYTTGIKELGPYADYLVINVSSPNTPGLRSLQQADRLRHLLTSTLKARDEYAPHAPLFVKLAPDLSVDEMKDIAEVLLETRADGMIVSNTTNARPDFLLSKNRYETGGLSGAPIRERSTECIRTMYQLTNGSIPIIGVGGVGSGRDAYEKIKAGASLIQVYSMMVYEGPGLISRITKELAEIIRENGHRSVEEVVGADCEEIYWRKREEKVNRKMKEAEKELVDI